jgi:ubiquinone biosynthesis protein
MPSLPGTVAPGQQLRRLREITTVLAKQGFPDVVARLHLERTVALGRRLRFWRRREPWGTKAERIRLALEELGPTFVKFGQALSTRADLLPEDLVAELSRLQDEVPPLPQGVAEAAIEAELGAPISALFATFDVQPVAAASIAQVHRAVLENGDEVAVKVRRPGIEDTIERDLAILGQLAWLAERYLPDSDLYQPASLVAEFARSIRRELDLALEGRTIDRFAKNFAGDATIRLPGVHWERTARGVLTLEFIPGRKVLDVLRAPQGYDLPLIARRGADLVLNQVLRHGLFHADPHPANIFVLPGNVICPIDFGNVGRVDKPLRHALASLVHAVVREDAERVTAAVLSIGRPLQSLDADALRRDVTELLEAYSGAAMRDLSIGALLHDALAVMHRHRLQFPVDLMLLARAFVTIEGVGRQLDPTFQMVEYARPVVAGIMRDRFSPSAVASGAEALGRELGEAMQSVPRDLVEIISKAKDDRLQIQFVHRNLEHFVQEMDRSSNRLSFAIVIAALIVGSSLVVQRGGGPHLLGVPALGLIGFVAAGLFGFWLAIGILRSGRL